MELKEIFEKLEKKEGIESGGSRGEELIQEVQTQLGLGLPDGYKEFLRQYGYARWDEGKLYGISKNLEYDVVHQNRLVRDPQQSREYRRLPEDAFLITGYLDAFFMLFAKGVERSDQVVLYLAEKPGEEKVWESFKAFLEEYCL